LARMYEKIRLYRDWTIGRSLSLRAPQKADLRTDRLENDFSNLPLMIHEWKTNHPEVARALLDGLRDLYDGISDVGMQIANGTAQIYFKEGDLMVPAWRLSDGTLRYLCLLAILYDPDPPSLICIEEPELGLHPDILHKVADHLVAA